MANTQDDLADASAYLTRAAASEPTRVVVATLEVLIDAASGTNPHLKDFNRLQMYRKIIAILNAPR